MEVAAAAIGVLGLVGLYSTCIEMLDVLSSAARYGIDRELLQTKIEVERVRLMIWGESAGLADIDLSAGKKEATEDDLASIDESLQRTALRTAVAGLLACFVRTFEDVEGLQKRYGLVPQGAPGSLATGATVVAMSSPRAGGPADGSSGSVGQPAREFLTSTFRKTYARFQDRTTASQNQASPLTKAAWAVADEKKFRALVAELRAINDSLVSLLPTVRDRTRVRIRAEIMQATDVGQLQNLVAATDEVADLVAETASLRIEMLSTKRGQVVTRKPVPRAVHVALPSPSEPQRRALTPEPPLVVPGTPSPAPQAVVAVAAPALLPVVAPASLPLVAIVSPPSQPVEPAFVAYDNTGALVVHKVYKTANTLLCYSWLSGIGEAPELSVTQREFHPAFALRFLPESIIPVADSFFEVDVDADPKYAGWSPGSTSLTGFSRELNFWRKTLDDLSERIDPSWRRTANTVSLASDFILKRWKTVVNNGLGSDWTDKKGYDSVRELCGPSDYTWLDQSETIKIRHQISDLLAIMSHSPVPSLGTSGSIGALANIEQVNANANFSFVDFLLQMLAAREVTLRMAKAKRHWYGGITVRIIYDLVAAELWAASMDLTADSEFEPRKGIRARQVDGILKFAEEMQWPYLAEIQEWGRKLLTPEATKMTMDVRMWDWSGGLVLPGAQFSLAIIGTLYNLSETLRTRLPSATIKMRKGNYGIVYPQASYWVVRSVLGKVLAPLSLADAATTGSKIKCLGGWVGPCPSPSVPESTFGLLAELKGRPPPWVAEDPDADGDVPEFMGPVAAGTAAQTQQGNTAEWVLPVPPPPSADMVTLQTLRLAKVEVAEPVDGSGATRGDDAPPIYQARLDFRLARGKLMATMTLHANSVFVAALPCRGGPHRIEPRAAPAYAFRTLGITDLPRAELDGGVTSITVINATGGPAAETFARAWCSEKGTNAVVWKRGEGCCFKCALMVASREGVAAGVLIMC